MAKIRPISVILILLCSGISILSGVLLDRGSPAGTANYRAIYYGARCIIDRTDPYQPSEFLRIYSAESGAFPSDPGRNYLFVRATTVCVNLPTTLFLVVPLALLPWGISHLIWLVSIAVSFTLAGLLAFDLARDYAPGISLLLICILLANSQVLFAVGNTAGIAVSLCVIAIWCFMRHRLEWLGVVLLAISLALKPHDSGLVWLYLLLAGGTLRKRSLQTLALTAILAIPALLAVSHVAPDWRSELRSNLAATSAQGDISDPGPTSISRTGSADVIIDLQTVASLFKDDSHFYNPLVYAVFGLILGLWIVITLSAKPTDANAWLALAAISAMTMLPSYHRPYDTRLLLLAVPACAMLWAEGRIAGRIAGFLSFAAVLVSADIPLAIISLRTAHIDVPAMSGMERFLLAPFIRPVPLALLALAVFNLVLYVRNSRRSERQPRVRTDADCSMPA